MAVRMTCGECGYYAAYKSAPSAEFHFPRHSCRKEKARQASARRGRARRAAVDRTPQPCRHKETEHRHGTHACYVLDACRCLPCSAANAAYEKQRARRRAYGHEAYVDATHVRQHVRDLMAAGMGLKTVAKTSGVPHGGLSKLIYGDPQRGLAPSKRVRWETAVRLLVVQATPDRLAGGARVDPTGTRRRVQALVAIGWSQQRIGDRIGMTRSNFGHMLSNGEITARTARAVAAVYDELWDTPPPQVEHRDKIAASRARNYARARGWAPPLAWDENTIDDPAATPNVGGYDEDRVLAALAGAVRDDEDSVLDLTAEDRLEVRRRGNTLGLTVRELADLTGIAANTFYSDTYRAGAAAKPNHRAKLPPADELQFLLDTGESIAAIASRYGATEDGVHTALRRSTAA